MRILKKISPIILFFLVFFIVNESLNYLFVPYTFSRFKIHNIETREYDTIILGTSHGVTALNATVIGDLLGGTAFNAAQGEEYTIDCYYLLKSACRNHKPKRVIYEYDPFAWAVNHDKDATYVTMVHEMPMSMVKLDYMYQKMRKIDFRYTIAPWFFYRGDLDFIKSNLREKTTDNYKNYGAKTFDSNTQTMKEDGFIAVKPGRWNDEILDRQMGIQAIQKSSLEYFHKLAQYCNEEGIELVVVTTPIPSESYWNGNIYFEAAYKLMDELAEKYGFVYLCYNYGPLMREEYMKAEKFVDWDGHMFETTANEFSEMFVNDYKMLMADKMAASETADS